jgi:hypothetical protein
MAKNKGGISGFLGALDEVGKRVKAGLTKGTEMLQKVTDGLSEKEVKAKLKSLTNDLTSVRSRHGVDPLVSACQTYLKKVGPDVKAKKEKSPVPGAVAALLVLLRDWYY